MVIDEPDPRLPELQAAMLQAHEVPVTKVHVTAQVPGQPPMTKQKEMEIKKYGIS